MFPRTRNDRVRSARRNAPRFRPELAGAALEDRQLLTVYNWILNGDGAFNNAANWRDQNNQAGVPGASDVANIGVSNINVSIPSGTAVNQLVTTASTRLNLAGSLTLNNVASTSSLGVLVMPAGSVVNVTGGTAFLRSGGDIRGTFNVSANAQATFQDGLYNLNAGATFSGAGVFELSGGAIFNKNVNVVAPANFTMSGGLFDGDGNFLINNTLTWTGGQFVGNGTTTASASSTININGGSTKYVTGGHILNLNGTVNFDGIGELDGGPGATINNAGTFNILSDAPIANGGAGARLVINNLASGVITKSGGSGTTSIAGNYLNNAGTINVNSGSILLNGDGIQTGTFNVAAGSTFFFGADIDLNFGTKLNGAGTYQVYQTTTSVNTDITVANLTFSGGIINGTATLTIGSKLNWTAGSFREAGTTTALAGSTVTLSGGNPKYLQDGRILNLNGTTNWTGVGELDGGPGSTINNAGTFNIQNNVVFGNGGAGARVIFNNSGTINKSGGGLTLFQDNILNNSGTVNVTSGNLQLNGDGVQTGAFNVSQGQNLIFSSAIDLNAGTVLNGAGTYQLTEDSLTINTPISVANFLFSAGTRDGLSPLTITGRFDWTGGTTQESGVTTAAAGSIINISGANTKYLQGGHTLNLNGNTAWTGVGEFDGGPGSVVNNAGTFTIQNDAVFGNGGAGAQVTFNNLQGATLTKAGGVGATGFDGNSLNNRGTVNVNSGTLRLNGGGTNFSTINVGAAGNLLFANNYTLDANSSIAGTGIANLSNGSLSLPAGTTNIANFQLSGGTVVGSGNLNVTSQLVWTGGTFGSTTGTTTIPAGSTLQILGNSGKSLDGRTLQILGIANWGGAGDINISSNGQLIVAQGGTFNIQSDRTLSGNGSVSVRGTLVKNTTAGTTTLSGPAITIDGGNLSVATGLLSLANGVTVNAGAGSVNLIGGVLATQGSSAILLNGGSLNGPGTIQGNVTNNGGLINTGAALGSILQVTGNYTQNANGTLAVKVGGVNPGQYDVLNVGGAATLGGNLATNLVNGFKPDVSNAFQVLTFASRTGTSNFSNYNGYRGIFNTPATTLNLARVKPTMGDFDGDGKADLSLFKRSTSTTSYLGTAIGSRSVAFGPANAVYPAPGDYQGDGKADITLFQPSNVKYGIMPSDGSPAYFDNYSTPSFTPTANDIPIAADYDGDGKTDVAYFRPSTATWSYRSSSSGIYTTLNFGAGNSDQPIPADFDGDGKADLALYRPSTSTFIIQFSSGGSRVQQFGAANSDIPVTGDFDGDGRFDIAIFRPSTSGFVYISSINNGQVSVPLAGAIGTLDQPVTLDYDGDGKTDFALYRPSTSTFSVLYSSSNPATPVTTQYGAVGDVPVYLPWTIRPYGLRSTSGTGGSAASHLTSSVPKAAAAKLATVGNSQTVLLDVVTTPVTHKLQKHRRDAAIRKLTHRAGH